MTIMLIFGAIAALYCLLLLFRCAIFAFPIVIGVGAGLHLHQSGFGWTGPIAAGLMTGAVIYYLGRYLMRSSAPGLLRTATLLLFAGAATAAGYQAGAAVTALAGFGPWWQWGLAVLAAFVTGCCSWNQLAGSRRGSKTHVQRF